MSYIISVIIPTYNAENTIKRAIDSVINQSLGFENIELILYDDASTDNTPKIIEDYANKYNNIVPILSKENSGHPSKGRNIGINVSNADYIMFLDNDDEYDINICENLYNELIFEDSDYVSCSYINLDEINSHKMYVPFFKNQISQEFDEKIIFSSENAVYFENRVIWNCIFKKNIILENKIAFPEFDYYEDIYFSTIYLAYVKKAIYLKNYFGLYRHVRDDSLSSSFDMVALNNLLDVTIDLFEYMKKFNFSYSLLFKGEIRDLLCKMYIQDLNIYTKQDLTFFLKRLKKFEENINFNTSLGVVFNFINYFILHEHYSIAIFCLKCLSRIHKSDFIRKLYRIFFN